MNAMGVETGNEALFLEIIIDPFFDRMKHLLEGGYSS